MNIAIRSASTSVAQSSSGGFWTWLTGARSNALPLPDFALPGVTIPPPLPDLVEPGKTKITTLSNGVKIASETSAVCALYFHIWLLVSSMSSSATGDNGCFLFPIQGSSCSVGVYIDCGSVYEAPETTGVSQLLKTMAFATTTNRSELRVVREIEAIGGSAKASASREMMSYTYGVLKTYMPEMVEVLIDCVRNPAFLDWEVKEQVFYLLSSPIHFCQCSLLTCFLCRF